MKIGFDGLALDNQSGSGVYARELLLALSRLDNKNEYHLFIPGSPEELGLVGLSSNFHPHSVWLRHRALRPLWVDRALPFHARRLKLDLLHSPQFIAPTRGQTPQVITIHDVVYEIFPETVRASRRAYYRRIVPRAANRAKAIIADSKSASREIQKTLGIPDEKMNVIPLGVSQEFFEPIDPERIQYIRRAYGLSDEYILSVGTLEPRKNLLSLLKAFAQLRESRFTAQLAIVGRPGWNYKQLLKSADSAFFSDRVRFLGFVPREDLPAIYQAAAAFAFPSLHEGFGLPILEAMASGLPIVASGIPVAFELLGKEGTALLVEPLNLNGWRNALEDVLKHKDLAHALGTQAKQTARKYTWERTARATLRVYENIVKDVGK